jgi:hypothetical protein
MDAADRYRKELDLIFQEIDEQERLQHQIESESRGEFILRLLSFKGVRRFLETVPPDQYPEIIQACVQRRFSQAQ